MGPSIGWSGADIVSSNRPSVPENGSLPALGRGIPAARHRRIKATPRNRITVARPYQTRTRRIRINPAAVRWATSAPTGMGWEPQRTPWPFLAGRGAGGAGLSARSAAKGARHRVRPLDLTRSAAKGTRPLARAKRRRAPVGAVGGRLLARAQPRLVSARPAAVRTGHAIHAFHLTGSAAGRAGDLTGSIARRANGPAPRREARDDAGGGRAAGRRGRRGFRAEYPPQDESRRQQRDQNKGMERLFHRPTARKARSTSR